MFHTYRYTKVRGPYSNQHPSISWEFYVEGETMWFKFTRCSPKDQFSYQTARQILSERDWYEIEYDPNLSLVENVIEVFKSLKENALPLERRIVKDYEHIQNINVKKFAFEHGVFL